MAEFLGEMSERKLYLSQILNNRTNPISYTVPKAKAKAKDSFSSSQRGGWNGSIGVVEAKCKMAMDHLAIQGSAAPVERLWSVAAGTVTQLCNHSY